MMEKIKICFAGVMFAITACAFANDCNLVKDGVAASCIVLSDNAGTVEKHAADELALFLEKVTGVKVAIGNAPSKELCNIYLGTSEAKNGPRSDTIDQAVSQLKDDGFVLAADKDGVRVIGKKPIGVLYGAYEILKKYAGIRWFAPGPDYEYCPRKQTVAVPEGISVHNPSFKFRHMGAWSSANWNSKTMDSWDWLVRNGMVIKASKNLYNLYPDDLEKRGVKIKGGDHSFSRLLSDNLFDEHSEYFCLRDGKRIKQEGQKRQPCTSNPKVVEIMAESLNQYLDSPPKGGSYLIGNNDSTEWCQCENCVKLDPPEEKEKRFVSTRYYTLINQIAGKVYKTHPDADLWGWAYQNYQEPPTGVTPDLRLTIEVCMVYRCYRHPVNDEKCPVNARYRKMLAGWTKFGNDVMTREYIESLLNKDRPPYIPVEHILYEDVKYYKQLGVEGFQLQACPLDGTYGKDRINPRTQDMWHAQWQIFYLAALLMWDVSADYEQIVEDMGSKYYGKAWPVMKQYRKLLVKMFEEAPGHIYYPSPNVPMMYGNCLEKSGVEAELLGLLGEAGKIATNDPIILKRVEQDKKYFQMCWQTLHKEFLAIYPKELNANKRAGKIVIDGKLDEADWQSQKFTDNFTAFDGKTAADPQTFVKILYDQENIYLAVEAMEPNPEKMVIKAGERDGAVWKDSSLEFFIAPPGMNGTCCQIVINPKSVFYDSLAGPARTADAKFDAQAEIKTAVLKDRWVTEVRIPFAPLGRKLQDGDIWKINIARNRHLVDGTSQLSSWSGGVFHGVDAYRSVVFGGTALPKNNGIEDTVQPDKH